MVSYNYFIAYIRVENVFLHWVHADNIIPSYTGSSCVAARRGNQYTEINMWKIESLK